MDCMLASQVASVRLDLVGVRRIFALVLRSCLPKRSPLMGTTQKGPYNLFTLGPVGSSSRFGCQMQMVCPLDAWDSNSRSRGTHGEFIGAALTICWHLLIAPWYWSEHSTYQRWTTASGSDRGKCRVSAQNEDVKQTCVELGLCQVATRPYSALLAH